ncbi:MAG: TetR/AcrR family transcriptional regulator [Bacteroidales bacterium]|jgi:AcrR family transcriptional regulator|nr:TetR/AcrR family transcriptional regulator [Bacteroidales bacterium]
MSTNIFLIQNCLNIFFAQGVKVSMDDIAKELGMSKRTLYEIFENKSELIYRCLSHLVKEEREKMIYNLSENGENIIEKLFPFLNFDIYDRIKKNHHFFRDIKRYYPEIFAKVLTAHIDAYLKYIGEVIKEGVSISIFRNDIQVDIVTTFFFSLMTTHNNKDMFQRHSIVDIFENTVLCYIRGISTPKGIKLIDDVLQRNHQHFENKKIKK